MTPPDMSEQRIPNGTRATVNGNPDAVVIGYDAGLGMYEVRMWSGLRHVGDVIVPESSIGHRLTLIELGDIMLREAGEDACLEGYQTTDPEWVGRYALEYGDVNPDGTLN